jgi:hypothetical protein
MEEALLSASAAVSLGSERNASKLSLHFDAALGDPALGVEMTKTYPCFYSRDGLASGRKIDRTDFTPMLVKRKRQCRFLQTKHPHARVRSVHAGGVLRPQAILEILPHRIPPGMSCLSPPSPTPIHVRFVPQHVQGHLGMSSFNVIKMDFGRDCTVT